MIETNFGELNVQFGWIWMVLGIASGSIIGFWAFDGPLPPPKSHQTYDALSRRMVRLAHIAFFALPMICILYGQYIDQVPLSSSLKMFGSYGMIACMVGVPIFLIAGSIYLPLKYLEIIPVGSGFAALSIMAWGHAKLLFLF